MTTKAKTADATPEGNALRTSEDVQIQPVDTVVGASAVTQQSLPVAGEVQIADASSVARQAGPLSAPDGTPVATRSNVADLIAGKGDNA